MPKPHAIPITLSQADRATLEGWTRRRKTAQALALRARIVLACAKPGATNSRVAEDLGVSRATVATWRRRFAERGPDGLLDEPRPGAPRKITDEQIERAIITTLEATPAQRHALEHAQPRRRDRAEPVSGGAHLAGLRAPAAPHRDRQALARSTVRRQGA
jgi:transposase-like protein